MEVEDRPGRRSRRILVVEDNGLTALALRALLTAWGHEVVVAHTGAEGLELAHCFRPEFVVCDLDTRDQSADRMAEVLQRDPDFVGAHLIALSALPVRPPSERRAGTGFELYLTKPVDIGALEPLFAAA